MADLQISIRGLAELQTKLAALPAQLQRYLSAAGNEAGHEVISTEGLQRYPPATAANAPPTPYYVRGRGTQLKSRNLGESQRYGTQWYIQVQGMRTVLGNRAGYAEWLASEHQARAMAKIGWRKLFDVAKEKVARITAIYEAWTTKGIKDQGL